MQHYMTRHLEALGDLSLGDVLYRRGDEFFATPVDAEYLIRRAKAREVAAMAPASQAAAPIVPSLPEQPKAHAHGDRIDGPASAVGTPDGAGSDGASEGAAADEALAAAAAPAQAPRRRTARAAAAAPADSSAAAGDVGDEPAVG